MTGNIPTGHFCSQRIVIAPQRNVCALRVNRSARFVAQMRMFLVCLRQTTGTDARY